MSESSTLREIWLALSRGAVRLFRNNCGEAWLGRWAWIDKRIVIDHPQRVRYGLVDGSADLVGWAEYTVMPEDVGKRVAVFLSVEVKGERTRVREDQRAWHDAVIAAGGIACIARAPRDAADAIENWRPV